VSTLTVNCFLGSLPKWINGDEKSSALKYFAEGVNLVGDRAIVTENGYEPCDVGVIIGNAFNANPGKVGLRHYNVRKTVMEQQTAHGRYWLSIDSNVFIYLDRANPHKYLRYSFNGVFPATGIYCNDQPGPDNWNNIRQHYNIDLKPWRNTGSHILITLQRPMGWSMRGQNLVSWLKTTIKQIRAHSDRPLRVRWHPGDWKNYPQFAKEIRSLKKITVSPQERHILEDLQDCWALVCHNSTPSSVAMIEGVPAFITDDPGYCQAGDVANTNFSQLENPVMPDRDFWIQKLAQCHWSFEDLKSGRCWSHMRNYVRS
jgi:hypothetical protein